MVFFLSSKVRLCGVLQRAGRQCHRPGAVHAWWQLSALGGAGGAGPGPGWRRRWSCSGCYWKRWVRAGRRAGRVEMSVRPRQSHASGWLCTWRSPTGGCDGSRVSICLRHHRVLLWGGSGSQSLFPHVERRLGMAICSRWLTAAWRTVTERQSQTLLDSARQWNKGCWPCLVSWRTGLSVSKMFSAPGGYLGLQALSLEVVMPAGSESRFAGCTWGHTA